MNKGKEKLKTSDEMEVEEEPLLSPQRGQSHVSPLLSPLVGSNAPSSSSSMSPSPASSSSFRLLMNEKPPPPRRYGIYALLYWFRHLRIINSILKMCAFGVFIICFCIAMGIIVPIFSLVLLALGVMLLFAMTIMFFRQICPSRVYNILIDAMNLPHAKTGKCKDVLS